MCFAAWRNTSAQEIDLADLRTIASEAAEAAWRAELASNLVVWKLRPASDSLVSRESRRYAL